MPDALVGHLVEGRYLDVSKEIRLLEGFPGTSPGVYMFDT